MRGTIHSDNEVHYMPAMRKAGEHYRSVYRARRRNDADFPVIRFSLANISASGAFDIR